MNKTFKLVAAILALFTCVCMVGCNNIDLSDTASMPNHSICETVNLDKFSFTPVEIAQVPPSPDHIFSPKDGNVFLIIKLNVKNISEEETIISSLGMFAGYADGKHVDLSIKAYTALTNVLELDGSLAPNETKTGHIIVEVPEDWQEFKLIIKSSVLSTNRALFTFSNQG